MTDAICVPLWTFIVPLGLFWPLYVQGVKTKWRWWYTKKTVGHLPKRLVSKFICSRVSVCLCGL